MSYPSVSQAARALKSPDARTRAEAAEHLFALGRRAIPALAELVDGLNDYERMVVYHCAKALGRIGPPAAMAISRLVEIFKDTRADMNDRSAAADALAGIGSQAVPELANALGSSDERVRQKAAWALGHAGPCASVAIPQLIGVLNDPIEMVRYNATETLQHLGARSLSALSQALNDADPLRRVNAGRALLKLRPNSTDGIQAMIACLKDRDPHVRLIAATALDNARRYIDPVIPEMIESMRRDKSEFVRMTIACTFAELGRLSPATEAALEEGMRDSCTGVRHWCATGLGRVRPITPEIIDLLSRALEHDAEQSVRIVSARSLGGLGSSARSVLPLLRRIHRITNDEELREEIEDAMTEITAANGE